MNCRYCRSHCIRKGKSNGIQKYRCVSCSKYQRADYVKTAYTVMDGDLAALTREGLGIRSTARLLDISPTTVIRRILKISRSLQRPPVFFGRTYQVDELFTYIGNKKNKICIAYSLETKTGSVIDIVVGRRNKTNLNKVVSTLVLADAAKIITDKLNIYKELIPKEIHATKFRGINRIERMNLSLRTMLKRLSRRTICYSRSLAVLTAVVKICFWYDVNENGF